MKSGHKIYGAVLAHPLPGQKIHALKNGALRSLLTFITAHEMASTPAGEMILAHAMAEATHRFVKKGGPGSL